MTTLSEYLIDTVDRSITHLNERCGKSFKARFLAHQIIADLEEIYEDPFGEVTVASIVSSSGGVQGKHLCQLSIEQGMERGATAADPIDVVLHNIIGALSIDSEKGDYFRRALGCVSDSDGRVTIALNGRPLNRTDVEHFMCKLYIGVSKTMPGRSNTQCPRPGKQGLHPVCFPLGQLPPWQDDGLRQIMETAAAAHQYILEKNWIKETPNIFILLGEADPLVSGVACDRLGDLPSAPAVVDDATTTTVEEV
jgi:hypothetical protein